MSKLIPSPDWFVGIDSLKLHHDVTGWINSTDIALKIYDAGTDKGYTFSAPNWEERPPVAVSEITSQTPSHAANSFYYPDLQQLPTIATLRLERLQTYFCQQKIIEVVDANCSDVSATATSSSSVTDLPESVAFSPSKRVIVSTTPHGQLRDFEEDAADKGVAEIEISNVHSTHRALSQHTFTSAAGVTDAVTQKIAVAPTSVTQRHMTSSTRGQTQALAEMSLSTKPTVSLSDRVTKRHRNVSRHHQRLRHRTHPTVSSTVRTTTTTATTTDQPDARSDADHPSTRQRSVRHRGHTRTSRKSRLTTSSDVRALRYSTETPKGKKL